MPSRSNNVAGKLVLAAGLRCRRVDTLHFGACLRGTPTSHLGRRLRQASAFRNAAKNLSVGATAVSSTAQPKTPVSLPVDPPSNPNQVEASIESRNAVENPLECTSYLFATSSEAAPVLESLSAKDVSPSEKRKSAEVVFRGLLASPVPNQRALAARSLNELQCICKHSLNEYLSDAAYHAKWASMGYVNNIFSLVNQFPLPAESILATSLDPVGDEQMRIVKPLDVLRVDEEPPPGMPHIAHAFLQVLGWKRGPMYRDKNYGWLCVEERNYFSFVIEHVRRLAPEFFNQYKAHNLQDGVTPGNLSMQLDAFLTIVSDKLFALALMELRPQLVQRQLLVDSEGCVDSRWRFVQQYLEIPPPLVTIATAFGIDWRDRKPRVPGDPPLRTWQRKHLWHRPRRMDKFTEDWFPTVDEFGEMALKTPLRHRPFVSLLSEMHAHEDLLLRPWYTETCPEEPVRHILWSAELVHGLSAYLKDALQVADYARKREGSGDAAVSPLAVLCVGSGASRLYLYLSYLLRKLLPKQDVRVVPMVPSKEADDLETALYHWPPADPDSTQNVQAENRFSLTSAIKIYRPAVLVCTTMPPRIDWSKAFRGHTSVLEYILVGPVDSDLSGDAHLTWGLSAPWRTKLKGTQAVVPYSRDGFVRHDLKGLSALTIGTDDAPGRVGVNHVTAFRRTPKQSLQLFGPQDPHFDLALPSIIPDSLEKPTVSRSGRGRKPRF